MKAEIRPINENAVKYHVRNHGDTSATAGAIRAALEAK